MTLKISQPVRRLAAVALLIVVLAFLALATVVPLTARVAGLRDQIETERVLLGKFMAVAVREGDAAELDRVSRSALESGPYLKGESEALMAASLQTMLAQLATADRVRFQSTRALPARERNETRLIGVSVQFHAEIEQVRALLFRIETHRPLLFVEGLQIRAVSPFSQRDAAQAGVLEVRLDVFGAIPGKKG